MNGAAITRKDGETRRDHRLAPSLPRRAHNPARNAASAQLRASERSPSSPAPVDDVATEVRRVATKSGVRSVLRAASMEKRVPLAYRLPALLFPLLFFVPALPPFVDYPQHVAIGAVLRRLADPTSFASQQYVANLFTYNGLSDELVALLSPPLPVEFAARLIVVVALELFVVGTFALFRRQRTHAIAHLLLVPLLPSFALFWGFTNHLLGLGLGVVLVASLVAVVADDDRRAWANLRVAAVALVLAHTHVLATLIALLIAASWVLDEAMRSSVTWPNRFRRVTHAALLVAPACAFCMAVHLRQFASHAHTYVLASEAETDTLLTKLQWFGLRVTGALRSHQDAQLVWAALLTAVVVAWFARGNRASRRRAATLPLIVLMSAYLAVPSAFVGTYLVYPRLALPVAMLALSLVPDSRRALPRVLTGIGALVALCTFIVTGSALWRFVSSPNLSGSAHSSTPAFLRAATALRRSPRVIVASLMPKIGCLSGPLSLCDCSSAVNGASASVVRL